LSLTIRLAKSTSSGQSHMAPFLERETASLALVSHVDVLDALYPHAVPLTVLVLSFVLVLLSLFRHKLGKVEEQLHDVETIQCTLTPSHKKRKARKQRRKTQLCIAGAATGSCAHAVPDGSSTPMEHSQENTSSEATKCSKEEADYNHDNQDLEVSQLGTESFLVVETHHPCNALELSAEESSIEEDAAHVKLAEMFQELENPNGCAGVPEAACNHTGPQSMCRCTSECSWGCPHHHVYSLSLMLMHQTLHKRIMLGAPGLEIDRSSANWNEWQKQISVQLLNRNSCVLVPSSRK